MQQVPIPHNLIRLSSAVSEYLLRATVKKLKHCNKNLFTQLGWFDTGVQYTLDRFRQG